MKFLVMAILVSIAAAAPQQPSYSYEHTKPSGAFGKPRVVATITRTVTKPVTYQVPVATITSNAPADTTRFAPQPQDPSSPDRRNPHPYIAILKLERNQVPSGDYSFSYLSENGIQASEKAIIKSVRDEKNDEQLVPNVEGSYSYTGPDGVVYTVNYVADELGYHASGSHLPTPPPIPEAIKQTLVDGQSYQ